MGAGRASRVAVAAVVGTVLLVTVLVTWAASIGPGGVLAGDGPHPHRASVTHSVRPSPSASPTATPTPRHEQQSHAAEVIGGLLTALAAIFAVVVVAGLIAGAMLLARELWQRWVERQRPPPPPPEIAFDVVETPRRVTEAIVRDSQQQRVLLLEGTPRNGIVECWHRFEEQAAGTGVVRDEWETSAEFTLRVLDLVDADSAAVTRLAGLYREARFSDHPLDESHRSAALEALDAIHAQLSRHGSGAPR